MFSVAEAEDALDEVEDELFRFARALESEHELRDALTDPRLPAERKRAVLAEVLGERSNPATLNLLGFVIDQGRARDRLAEALERATGRKVELKVVVDPTVVGGVVAKVGDQVIDGSVRRRLELARERLSEV